MCNYKTTRRGLSEALEGRGVGPSVTCENTVHGDARDTSEHTKRQTPTDLVGSFGGRFSAESVQLRGCGLICGVLK